MVFGAFHSSLVQKISQIKIFCPTQILKKLKKVSLNCLWKWYTLFFVNCCLCTNYHLLLFTVKIAVAEGESSRDRFTVQRMLVYRNAFFLPGHAVSSMQTIWSNHNVVKEPICTLPWQSLALDQLKYLQVENLSANNKFNVGSVGIIHYFFCNFSTPPSYLRLLWNTILLWNTLWDRWDTCEWNY